MAPIKKARGTRRTRNRRKIKTRRRRPNIEEMVHKLLGSVSKADREDALNTCETKCHCCKYQERQKQVSNTSSVRRPIQKSTGHKFRRDTLTSFKPRSLKHHNHHKSHGPVSCLHRDFDNEGSSRTKKYIREALHFGMESGYLIPSGHSRKILRVSSDLMQSRDQSQRSVCERSPSPAGTHERERSAHQTPSRLDEYQVQDAKRRKRRRRRKGRSRSGSRRRRRSRGRHRRRSRSGNPEEVNENDDRSYDEDDEGEKRNSHREDKELEQKSSRSNSGENEKKERKERKERKEQREENSDGSVDDEETDEEEEKKDIGASKS